MLPRIALLLVLALPGCASVVKTVVTAPFKAGAVVVDSVTTTQAEADEDRGRAIRKQEAADRKAARQAEQARRKPPQPDA